MRPLIIGLSVLAMGIPARSTAQQSIFTFVQMDRLEYQDQEEEWIWDMQGWVGGDQHKIWWKTEGAIDNDDQELQLLYSRAISPFWDLQMGLRHSQEIGSNENSAVIGLQGLAPQWFEVDAAAFLTDDGELEARIEVEYDLLLTQRLIFQPRLELDSEENATDFSLRLRYEIRREIAPYIGIGWNDSKREGGDVSFIAGARFWF